MRMDCGTRRRNKKSHTHRGPGPYRTICMLAQGEGGETNERMRGETGQGGFRVGQREGVAMTAKLDPSKYKE